MTISNLVIILALALGTGTSQSINSTSTSTESITREGKPVGNCWINGTWYNPCPDDAPVPHPDDEPSPEVLLP
jgi:hypothetical protein